MKKFNIALILFLLISSLLMSSCNKENCDKGTVRFTNTSNNPYELYIEDVYKLRIEGSSFEELDILEGNRSARVEQVSGFVLFPTILNNELSVFGCQEIGWIFP